MKRNPYARIDVPKLLERLEIRSRALGGGRKHEASCPNPGHPDATASWFIRDNPGEPYHAAHKCQGCGFGGGPLILVSTILGVDEDAARDYLADLSAPPPLPTRVELEFVEHERKGTFRLPPCFKFPPFARWPEAHRAYAAPRVAPWQIERWRLGYVEKCECEGRRHRNRIAIPVRDERGELCAYTARAIRPVASKKYSEPRTDEHARSAILGSEFWSGCRSLVLVEGPFDAFAVEKVLGVGAGVGVGALRGSNPHPAELLRISMFERVVVMTDPDKAGKKARENIMAACARHSDVRSLVLPVGADPSKLSESEDGSEYLMKRLRYLLDD